MSIMRVCFLVLISVFALAFTVRADTTYNVDLTVGAGSVSGYIETDGAIGTISDGDIVDYNLLLNNGSVMFDLTGPLSGDNSAVDIIESDLTATATQLLFNFGASDGGFFLIQYPFQGSDDTFVCFESNLECTSTPAGISLSIGTDLTAPAQQTTAYDTSSVIGTATAAPEPGSRSLMLIGVGLLGLMMLRKRKAQGLPQAA
jgi:hypothetical protein